MSNSPLVSYTKISPNRTSPRNHKIDTITIHCVVGQYDLETIGNIFSPPSAQASCNYGISYDGKVGMYVEEKDRSWCSSNRSNDNRAITIEVASDTTHPYAVKKAAYDKLIDLLVDICKRNGIPKLLWKADKSLIGQVDKQNMSVHRWFANKSCPGTYLYERHGDIANKVDAFGLQHLKSTVNYRFVQFEIRDSESQQTTNLLVFFIYGDIVTILVKASGASQTRRTRPDNSNLFTIAVLWNAGSNHSLVKSDFGDSRLVFANSNRFMSFV